MAGQVTVQTPPADVVKSTPYVEVDYVGHELWDVHRILRPDIDAADQVPADQRGGQP